MGERIELGQAVVVLTGASSGIGLAAAKLLAGQAARLIVHGVTSERPALPADVEYVVADFRRLAAVGDAAKRIAAVTDRVDVLINNAGIPGPARRTVTEDGHEATFQVNVIAGALLTDRLAGVIPAGGRVVNVGSATHFSATLDPDDPELQRAPYSPVTAYANSKLAVTTYSAWLAAQLEPAGVDVVSVHPGVISTGLLHAMFGAGGAPVAEAAEVLLDLARRPLTTGAYYDQHRAATPNPAALDRGDQDRLARYVRSAFDASRTALSD
jgi:NAD(P)-dependent dehydrogenase (short-subunit alcohol dehydrogenase family)